MAGGKSFLEIGQEIGQLVTDKNAAYGDSFALSGQFLRLLYPDGIRPDQYDDALAMVRIFDKQKRIATDKDAFGESPYWDIAGYGVLGISFTERRAIAKRRKDGDKETPICYADNGGTQDR